MGSTANEITMLIDTSKCIGCRACQVACKQWHSLPAETDEGTATGGTSNTLVDVDRTQTTPLATNTLSWAINQWAGRGVQIVSGTGVGQKRTIESNTDNTLTVSSNWTTIPASDSIYRLSTTFTGEYTNPPDMSASNLTVVKYNESPWPGQKFFFFKDMCRHCYQPKCKRGCPGGVYKTSQGFVMYNAVCNDDPGHMRPRKKPNPDYPGPGQPKKINMTFADHCPYNIPRLDTNLNRYVKCDFCYDRFAKNDHGIIPDIYLRDKSALGISQVHTTACEFACPTGAIVTGSYADIMKGKNKPPSGDYTEGYAKRRYRAIIRDYPLARLYAGIAGRVNVIYLLTDVPERYGLPATGR